MLEKNCQIPQIYDTILRQQNSIMSSQYGSENLWQTDIQCFKL